MKLLLDQNVSAAAAEILRSGEATPPLSDSRQKAKGERTT
jgi:hypothetical protein